MTRTRHRPSFRCVVASRGHGLLAFVASVAFITVPGSGVGCVPTPSECDGACIDSGVVDPDSGGDSSVAAVCGDSVREGAEACDGVDLGGDDCVSLGFAGGMLACDGACQHDTSACVDPPTVPVTRKPMNGAQVGNVLVPGSLRPLFAWEPSTVGGGLAITYELEYDADPGFTAPIVVTSPSPDHQPAADLTASLSPPVGTRYYWRVRACVGAACSAYSPAWYFDAGRSDRDFNGDGFADSLVGALNAAGTGRAYVFYGAVGSGDVVADVIFDGEAFDDGFGFAVAAAGDVNGDGFADVIVGAFDNDAGGASAGSAYVFFGGATGSFDTTPDGIFVGAVAQDTLGISVGSAGDVNGDGFADVIVGAYGDDTGGSDAGAALVYFGGPGTSVDATPDGVLVGMAAGDNLGVSVGSAGDVNGDGFGDVIVGANGDDSAAIDAGGAYIYLGAAGTSLEPTPDAVLQGQAAGDAFGSSVATAGDLNDDGFADVIVGARNADSGAMGVDAGAAYVFFGGAGTTLDTTPDGTLQGEAAGDQFGRSVSGAGDVNGDGFDDVVVGAYLSDIGDVDAGAAYVFFGGAGASFDTTHNGSMNSFVAAAFFGRAVSAAGDVNGDGFDDVIIGAHGSDPGGTDTGAAFVYFGATGAVVEGLPDTGFFGDAAGDLMGISVAVLERGRLGQRARG